MRITTLFIILCINSIIALAQENLKLAKTQNQSALTCNNWLVTPSNPSAVSIGELDIPGTQITVEATFNRTTSYTGGPFYAGDLVAKHESPANVNYLLRPNSAEITTSNGYFSALADCEIDLNKTYHVAMTYNGSALRFYRNGFLLKEIAATGTLYQNNYLTRIGYYNSAFVNTQFVGYINEVRIWNTARSQPQIRQYMNSSLPSPTIQTELQAYYTFDNLLNKQGNAAYNGVINGSASINATNPQCNFTADSCNIIIPPADTIINSYTPVLSLDICKNKITVEDASEFHVGDTVLMIQMKGAVIDSTNTAAFGNITNYRSAGNYEFNYIKSITGNIIELKNTLTRSYEIPAGKVQLIRVPYFQNFTANTTVTCLPWDGSKGGVLVVNAADSIILNGNIDASGKGFRGGADPVTNPSSYFCNENQFFYPVNADLASEKGESIAIISAAKSFGKGAPANGGGGGNSHNSGGGGGANAGAGGLGGYQLESSPCNGGPGLDNRGISGKPLAYSNAANKIFMGGGGGAGQSNNPQAFESNGGNGAGIIIVMGNKLKSNGFKIMSNGNDAVSCGNTGSGCHEGMGGGGAGGTGLIKIITYLDPASLELKGGNGADLTADGFFKVGPGGGGGGGAAWISQASLPGNVNVANSPGTNGVCTGYANDPWGATAGSSGQTLFNVQIPVDNIPFSPNIDSVRFNLTQPNCNTVNVNGLAYFNPVGTLSWAWTFGDGGTANTQNASHTYSSSGPRVIWLFVTDSNGCKDSISRNITANNFTLNINPNTAICRRDSTQLTAGNALSYSWSPATDLSNPNIANPMASPASTQLYTVTGTNANGCTATANVTVTVNQLPVVRTLPDTAICLNTPVNLNTTGAASYSWSPSAGLSNPALANPVFGATSTGNYTFYVTGTSTAGCIGKDTLLINVKPLPFVRSIADSLICPGDTIILSTTGALSYSWSPAAGLNSANAANPIFTGSVGGQYIVTGTAANGCKAKDTVNISFKTAPLVQTIADDTLCVNQSILLTSNGAQIYSWSPAAGLNNPNISNPVFSGTAGNYTFIVTGTAANGCKAKDTVNIVSRPALSFVQPPAKEFCTDESVVLDGYNGSGPDISYTWTPNIYLSNDTIINPIANPPATQNYQLNVTDELCNNTSIFNIVVTVNPLPLIDARRSNDLSCSVSSAQLTATGASSYSWEPAVTLAGANTASPVASPGSTTVYTVTGTDAKGCFNTDTVTVKVIKTDGGFFLPNAFTPNEDFINDCFGIRHWGAVSNLRFIIYNRWGEKVFETIDYNECWNGKYKGQPADPGGYVYYITGTSGCGTFAKKGNVTLLR